MAIAKIDTSNRLTPEDVDTLKALHEKINQNGTLPAFGEPNQETWVLRDEDRIVGFIHFEHLVEIRAMITDPDYEYKKMALTIAKHSAETCLRRFGHPHYYITVPKDHEHVKKFYDSEAEQVDTRSLRYRKGL